MQWITFSEFVQARTRRQNSPQQSDNTGPVGTSESPRKIWDKTLKLAWETGKRLKQQAQKVVR